METKIKGEFKEFYQGKYYRVCNTSRLVGLTEDSYGNITLECEYLPEEYGLAIEEKLKDNTYYVVAFVEIKDNELKINEVETRCVDGLRDGSIDKLKDYVKAFDSAFDFMKMFIE